MDISNKTLAMFLVAAIVVSIAGTTISLNRLGEMGTTGPTGYATSDVGNVTVNVGASVSIVINSSGEADTLGFTCTPSSTQNYVINSENTQDTGAACSGAPTSGIFVYNDGNVDANVSINVSDVGENTSAHTVPGNFLTSTVSNSWIAYKTTDGPNVGCAGTNQAAYTNFTQANAFHLACDNLSAPYGDFRFDVEMLLPRSADTVSGDFVEVTFWAKQRT